MSKRAKQFSVNPNRIFTYKTKVDTLHNFLRNSLIGLYQTSEEHQLDAIKNLLTQDLYDIKENVPELYRDIENYLLHFGVDLKAENNTVKINKFEKLWNPDKIDDFNAALADTPLTSPLLDISDISLDFKRLVLKSLPNKLADELAHRCHFVIKASPKRLPNNWINNDNLVLGMAIERFPNFIHRYIHCNFFPETTDWDDFIHITVDNLVHRFKDALRLRVLNLSDKYKKSIFNLDATANMEPIWAQQANRLCEDSKLEQGDFFSLGLILLNANPELSSDDDFMRYLKRYYLFRFPQHNEKIASMLKTQFPDLTSLWDSNIASNDSINNASDNEGAKLIESPAESTETNATTNSNPEISQKPETLSENKSEEVADAPKHSSNGSEDAKNPIKENSQFSISHTDNLFLEEPLPEIPSHQVLQSMKFAEGDGAYIGYVRKWGNHINFFPIAQLQHGKLRLISTQEARSLWPSFGAILLTRNIGSFGLTPNYVYLAKFDARLDVEFNIDDKTGKPRPDYELKIRDFETLYRQKDIVRIDEDGAYLIVYPKDDKAKLDEKITVCFNHNSLPYDDTTHYSARFKVILSYGNKYYGPVKLNVNAKQEFTVNLIEEYRDGVVPVYFTKDPSQTNIKFKINSFASQEETYFDSEREVFILQHPSVYQSYEDLWSDEKVLTHSASSLGLTWKEKDTIENWSKTLGEHSAVFCSEPTIQIRRQKRLIQYANRLNAHQATMNDVALAIEQCLGDFGQKESLTPLVKLLSQREDFLKKIEGFESIKKLIDEAKLRHQKLHDENEAFDKLIQKRKSQYEIDTEKRLAQLQSQLEDGFAKLSNIDNYEELLKAKEKLSLEVTLVERQIDDQEKIKEQLEKEIETLSENLAEAVSPSNLRDLAVDSVLAQKLGLNAPGTFSTTTSVVMPDDSGKTNKANIAEIVCKELNDLSVSTLTGKDLVNYLVTKTQKLRQYGRNEILNLYICLSQSFLTVLSGKPGSGKTSICDIMAHTLGLNSISHRISNSALSKKDLSFLDRFLPVSVERGWTSKRDFLGYYNPLNQTFESQDPRRYVCFQTLDREMDAGQQKLPFVILLDEANLSQMEYYWADFMNICDQRTANSSISLGDGQHYRIPDTLRFVATINSDQTTEILSPRLIDRSWVIVLPEPKMNSFDDFHPMSLDPKDESIEIISWEALQQTLRSVPALNKSQTNTAELILDAFYKSFQKLGYSVSFRSRKAIVEYIRIAAHWFEGLHEHDKVIEGIDFAIAQKLLPCINLVGSNNLETLEELFNHCKRNNLTRSKGILKDILDRGERSMDMYTFFQ